MSVNVVLSAILVAMLSCGAVGQTCYQEVARYAQGSDSGRAMAVADGRLFMAGTEFAGITNPLGYVYVIQNDALMELGRLEVEPEPSTTLRGEAIAADGDVVVVGVPDDGSSADQSGAAYVFRYDPDDEAWHQEQRLELPATRAVDDEFGASVAVRGDTIAVGAPGDDTAGHNAGAAYIYQYTNLSWEFDEKIVSPLGAYESFGASLVAVDDELLVGAPAPGRVNNAGGTVYVCSETGSAWSIASSIGAAGLGKDDRFGAALAHDGAVLAVGAPGDDAMGLQAGAVYVFRRSARTWAEEDKLVIPDGWRDERTGEVLAVSGDRIMVPLWRDDDLSTGTGSAHVFEHSAGTWSHAFELWADINATLAYFGRSGAFLGDRIIVSADPASSFTRVVLFESVPVDDTNVNAVDCDGNGVPDECELLSDCDGNGEPDRCDIAAGAGDCDRDLVLDACEIANGAADCNANGIPDECEIIQGLIGDCNVNGVPDDCELVAGEAQDCNGNGVPDSCELFDYAQEQSNEQQNWITTLPSESLWMNRYDVQPGKEQINTISLYFSSLVITVDPITALVYDDPNNDGDPSDAVLLAQRTYDKVLQRGLVRLPIGPVHVGNAGDSFFIGMLSTGHGLGDPGLGQPLSRQPANGPDSWWGIGEIGAVDVQSLTGFNIVGLSRIGTGELESIEGVWILRADATHFDGEPVECSCPTDIAGAGGNADGAVGVLDLLEMLSNWGACSVPCAPFCVGDVSGPGGLPDCAVNVHDLLALLTSWGTCDG